jgi:hypothetical protein
MTDTINTTPSTAALASAASTISDSTPKRTAKATRFDAPSSTKTEASDRWPDVHLDIKTAIAPQVIDGDLHFFGISALDTKVDTVAAEYGVDKAIVGSGLFVAAATALGLNVTISASEGWRERAIIWLTLLCPPAFKKSVIMRTMAGHLSVIQRREHTAWKIAFQAAQAERTALEKAWAAYERRLERSLISGDGIPVAPDRHPSDVELPPEPCLMSDNFTPASIIDCVYRSRRGILLRPDELASVLASARVGSQMRSLLLTGFEGGELTVSRGKPAKNLTIARFGFSFMTSIQPDALRRLPLSQNDGMFTRFIWLSQKTRPPFVLPSGVGDDPVFSGILDRLRTMGERSDGNVPLSPAAVELFKNAATGWHARDEVLGGVAGSWHARAPSHCLRIALTMACTEAAYRGRETLPSAVPEPIMRRAVMLVDKIYIPRMLAAVECLGETPVMSTALRLIRHLHHNQLSSFNRRGVYRANKGIFGDLKTFNDAVEDLLRDGLIKPAEAMPGKSGRRSSDFVVNPKLLKIERQMLR